MKSKNNERSVTTIKIKKFRFISTRPIHYILLAIAILIVALLIGVSVANAMQISMLISDTRALRHEVAVLHREQEINRAQIEGQALFRERIDSMALEDTGRVFSIEKYRQRNKANSGGSRLPDWVHACNGQPVLKENGITDFVRGLDGEYRPSVPEWEVPASAACLHT